MELTSLKMCLIYIVSLSSKENIEKFFKTTVEKNFTGLSVKKREFQALKCFLVFGIKKEKKRKEKREVCGAGPTPRAIYAQVVCCQEGHTCDLFSGCTHSTAPSPWHTEQQHTSVLQPLPHAGDSQQPQQPTERPGCEHKSYPTLRKFQGL